MIYLSTFLAHYLHKFSAVLQIMHFLVLFGTIKVGANLAWNFLKVMLRLHLLVVIFATNLVSNISTKASNKALNLMLNKHLV